MTSRTPRTPLLPDEASFEPNEGPGPALVTFDFDGTLAEHEGGWSLCYRLFGVEDAGEARTAAFWDDERSYEAWAAGNVADWRDRGVRREHVERAAAAVKLVTGAADLLSRLRVRGVPFGVVSAGVRGLARPVERFDPSFVVSNEVVYDDDGVPVDVVPRVPPGSKGEILARLCEDAGVDLDRVVHVGDGESDLAAFERAGTAVLFDPDDRFLDDCSGVVDHVVHERDLSALEPVLLGGAGDRPARGGGN